MKKAVILIMLAAFSCGFFVFPAFAEDDMEKPDYRATGNGDAMLVDLILLRPLGLASIGFGFAATVVGLPFSIIANNTREVGDAMLTETTNYTFVRPLGDIFQQPAMMDR